MISNLSLASRRLLFGALGFGFLHHADHAMRVDHSGWPFLPQVTPYTFSLLIYPALFFILWAPASLRLKSLITGAIAAGVIFAHIKIETPQMQYAMWAYNRSLEPAFAGVQNIWCVQSPTLGWAAVIIAMCVNILLTVLTLSLVRDAAKLRSGDRHSLA